MPRKATPTASPNPTLPFQTIEIDGVAYKMCFDYEALAQAEEALMRKGYEVNLLIAMIRRNFSTLRVLFAVSLMPYQPDMDFHVAQSLVTKHNVLNILQAVDQAWAQSTPEKKPADPQEPAE
jgi:hypothetical protein